MATGMEGADMSAVDEFDTFVGARMRADAVPGLSVAVVDGDRVRWLRGFGTADLATGAPAGPQTAYLWFSMTKIVAATAVMRLSEQGLLDLDAPVSGYFPPFPFPSRTRRVSRTEARR
jgi:CubicO group peptidase (beta-lactamase class C family)